MISCLNIGAIGTQEFAYQRQTQSGAKGFGGKERFKDSFEIFFCNARTMIANADFEGIAFGRQYYRNVYLYNLIVFASVSGRIQYQVGKNLS